MFEVMADLLKSSKRSVWHPTRSGSDWRLQPGRGVAAGLGERLDRAQPRRWRRFSSLGPPPTLTTALYERVAWPHALAGGAFTVPAGGARTGCQLGPAERARHPLGSAAKA
jgi:hypothetical protein